MNVMPISDLIDQVSQICKRNGVQRLDLFGSFATGTATPTSDIDFVVYGCKDILHLEDELADIDTLRKIDIFEYYRKNLEKIGWKANILIVIILFAVA